MVSVGHRSALFTSPRCAHAAYVCQGCIRVSALHTSALPCSPLQCTAFTQTYPKCEWSPALRRLANHSFDAFAGVQECLAKEANPVNRVVFVQQSSKLYRAFIHEQVDLLRKRQAGGSGDGERGP